ncbi:hypothetical protein T439DRAFT_117413 [Meredithblackwellia eburnea MCA 4105]
MFTFTQIALSTPESVIDDGEEEDMPNQPTYREGGPGSTTPSLSPPPSSAGAPSSDGGVQFDLYSPQSPIHSDEPGPGDISAPASTTTGADDDHAETDSLIDATQEEVEARAQEFLQDELAPHPLSLPSGSGNRISAAMADEEARLASLGPKISLNDLPRKIPKSAEQQEDQQHFAVAFLRKCIEDADETEWMYETPSVFAPPTAMDPRGGEGDVIAGPKGGPNGEGAAWMDHAFNLDGYPTPSEAADSIEDYDEVVQMENVGMQFMDTDVGAAAGPSRSHGTPYIRDSGEEDAIGAGFGMGGRTHGLVRRVSEMAMS